MSVTHITNNSFITFKPNTFFILSTLFATCVFLYLGFFPPHALDLALSDFFYSSHGFIWHGLQAVEFIHSYGKIFVIVLLVFCLYVICGRFTHANLGKDPNKRATAWYVLSAVVLCLVLTSLLKKMTGMSCPWDLRIYGGDELKLATPLLEAFKGHFSGKCWPSGFAGSVFCLLALCFVPSFKTNLKVTLFFIVSALGFAYGVLQIGRGAHFLSHVIASWALDYAVCAFTLMAFNALHIFDKKALNPIPQTHPKNCS